MEWVISKINTEVQDLATAAKSLQNLAHPPTVKASSLPEC